MTHPSKYVPELFQVCSGILSGRSSTRAPDCFGKGLRFGDSIEHEGIVMGFAVWKGHVSSVMRARFLIDIKDAGLEDDRLLKSYRSQESPEEFVIRFGEKYGLLPVADFQRDNFSS